MIAHFERLLPHQNKVAGCTSQKIFPELDHLLEKCSYIWFLLLFESLMSGCWFHGGINEEGPMGSATKTQCAISRN